MAKYDPDRIDETADPFAPGTSGIEPLCDEFGRIILAPGSGGGGGGDASAANQVLGLTALDQIYDALALVGTEATSADILAAVNSLAAGATLADLAAALAPLATESTQQDVLAALETQAIDVGLIQANVALLVPDVDAMKDSLASIDGKVLTNAQLRASPVSVSGTVATTSAAASQADGHSATIGATTDTTSADTLIGRVKNLLSRIPAALVGGRFDSNLGSWLGSTAPTVGLKTAANSIPVVHASDQTVTITTSQVSSVGAGATVPSPTQIPAVVTWGHGRLYSGSTPGLGYPFSVDASGRQIVIGAATSGSAVAGNPVLVGGSDGTNARTFATNSSGHVIVAGPGATTATTSISTAEALVSTTPTGAISAASSGTLKASPGRLLSFRVEGVSNGTYYLQLHDAASTGAISAGTIKGLGYEIGGSGDELVVQFAAPISFAAGISWAISSTKNTYTASASTAFADGVWE